MLANNGKTGRMAQSTSLAGTDFCKYQGYKEQDDESGSGWIVLQVKGIAKNYP